METIPDGAGWVPNDRFKSYYVVWKLRYLNTDLGQAQSLNRTMQYGNAYVRITTHFLKMFKSYYVVWKPMFSLPNNNKHSKFKSYYVVWKRFAGRDKTQGKNV